MLAKHFLFTGLLLLSFSAAKVYAQSNPEKEWNMRSYYFILLKTGPNRTHDSATAAAIMKGHLDNITRLFNEKKLVLAGPFLDDSEYRGIFILDAPSLEAATRLADSDPAIAAGRLAYEIHPWYGPGSIIVKKGKKKK